MLPEKPLRDFAVLLALYVKGEHCTGSGLPSPRGGPGVGLALGVRARLGHDSGDTGEVCTRYGQIEMGSLHSVT